MTVAKDNSVMFKQVWCDPALKEKNTGEYVMWAYFQLGISQVSVHLSEKNIPIVSQFVQDFRNKFDSMLNTSGGGKMGKVKGRGTNGAADSKAMDLD